MEALGNLDNKQAVIGGIILSILYYFLLYDDGTHVRKKILETETQIQQVRDTKTKIEEALQERERFEKEAEEINKSIQTFLLYFPIKSSSNELMKFLSEKAESNGVSVVNLKPVEKKSEYPNYTENAYEFQVEGSFHQIMRFLASSTDLKRATDFHDLKLVSTQGGDFPTLLLSAQLVTYGYSAPTTEDQ